MILLFNLKHSKNKGWSYKIRHATKSDLPNILDIYNDAI